MRLYRIECPETGRGLYSAAIRFMDADADRVIDRLYSEERHPSAMEDAPLLKQIGPGYLDDNLTWRIYWRFAFASPAQVYNWLNCCFAQATILDRAGYAVAVIDAGAAYASNVQAVYHLDTRELIQYTTIARTFMKGRHAQ